MQPELTVVSSLSQIATSAMFGIIWLVQLVHYPMLRGLERSAFAAWHAFHSRRISFVVAPLMLVELVSAIGLALARPGPWSAVLLALTAIIWLSTIFVSVPIHNRLGAAGSEQARLADLDLLTRTNWIRTLVYTAKLAWAFSAAELLRSR